MKKHILFLLLFVGWSVWGIQSQTFRVTYNFNSDLSANIVSGAEAVSCWNAVPGGTQLQYNGPADDAGTGVLKLRIPGKTAADFKGSFVRCDISPQSGYRIRITGITVRQRIESTHTHTCRIGCYNQKEKIPADTSDIGQSSDEKILGNTYSTGTFTPGTDYAGVSGNNTVSAFVTVAGSGNTGDDSDWLIDEISIEGVYEQKLVLPSFTIIYDFSENLTPSITGSNEISVATTTVKSNGTANGTTPLGRFWLKTLNNSNNIGLTNMGIMVNLLPETGTETVINNYQLIHTGSGTADASHLYRFGVFRHTANTGTGTEAGREDFTVCAGRDVYGDAVPFNLFKKTTIQDDFAFNASHYFNFSVNRIGNPAAVEYWTVDRLVITGWCVPAGRSNLLKAIAAGQDLLLAAQPGEEYGEYKQDIYDGFYNLLSDAVSKLVNTSIAQGEIDNLTTTVQQAVSEFPGKKNTPLLTVTVNTQTGGNALNEGFAGFNVRITDDPWNYTHPDFVAGCKEMSPGFLRYFSGTSGNYLDIHTGQYELQRFEGQCISPGQGSDEYTNIPELYKWMEGKGSHSISNLNKLSGELGSRLIVTWNGFYDTPAQAAAFARFCKNNHIIVDCWQFCNEPNFFETPRRYFWISGSDYMSKMKEIADSILSVFPDADLAPSYGWSFTSSFPKEIKAYQDELGGQPWWNYVSVHSYPTNNTTDVTFNDGYLTANRYLYYNTINSYFSDMRNASWEGSKMLVTEFGVWNNTLTDKLYSALYVAEYYMRLSRQPRAWMLGKHHITSSFKPQNTYKETIFNAYNNQTPLNTDELAIGYNISMEGNAHSVVNKALKNSSYVYPTSNDCSYTVPIRGSETITIEGVYTVAYKGINDKDYLLISNKTPHAFGLNILIDNQLLEKIAHVEYFSGENPESKTTSLLQDTRNANEIVVYPYSVMRIEWPKDAGTIPSPLAPRIFSVENKQNSVFLKWWKREIAEKYTVYYGTQPGNYTQSIEVTDNAADIQGLTPGQAYYFAVTASNAAGTSPRSNEATGCIRIPEKPVINYIHEDNQRVTIHWESVPFASGYKVSYGTAPGAYLQTIDAGSISGYIFRKLNNNTRYYFTVTAYNGAGESPAANEISGTPVACRPWTPYLVNATEKTDGSVQIAWTPSDSAYNARYNVYYCPTPWDEAHYSLIAENISGTGFSDTTPRKAGTHYYRVKAVNDTGISQFYSQTATVIKKTDTGIAVPQTTKSLKVYPNPAKESVTIELPDNNGDISYRIYSQLGVLTSEGKGNWVSLEKCPHGVLILEVFTGKDVQYARIIRE